jgi:hypothetical protein
MRAQEFVTELNIDNKKGWGQTPNNANVDYKGLLVKMRPTTFLKLAAQLTIGPEEKAKIATLIKHNQSGGTFGAPTLYISIPREWEDGNMIDGIGRVTGHEGRHRMNAELEMTGDTYVETHIFISGFRTKNWAKDNQNDYTEEIITELATRMETEDGKVFTRPPLFVVGR